MLSSYNHTKKLKGPSLLEIQESTANNFLEYLIDESEQSLKKYGGIIRLSQKEYIIADPNAFKYILKTNPTNFTKKNMTYNRIKLIFGDGLIVSEGSIWEQHRALLQPLFERQKMEQYASIMVQCTQEKLHLWRTQNISHIDVLKEMNALMLKIAFLTFCNHQPTAQEIKHMSFALKWGNAHISHALFPSKWFPTPNNLIFFWSLKKMNTVIKNIITHRKQNPTSEKDLVNTLLTAQKNKEIPLTDAEIQDEVKTMLLTGHETTACGITATLYLLAKHPEYQILMEKELQTILGDKIPTLEDCSKLPLTKAIFLESLRLYPTIWCLPRRSIHKDTVCGYEIPANAQLILNIYSLHRNPEYWEEPLRFNPNRFLEDASNKRHPFSYLPFSTGPHSCIGINFAITEGILFLAMMGRSFHFELLHPKKPYKLQPYLSLRPPKGFKLKLGVI